MATSWKRTDWNDIIQGVNALADYGCTGGSPLEEVDPNHIWTIQDIEIVRAKLTQVCSNNPSFNTELNKWKQEIIDELDAAIANCECCDPDGDAGIIYGPFNDFVVTPYGEDHWVMYSIDPAGMSFGSPNLLGRWASITLYGAHLSGGTSLKTTPSSGPVLDCNGVMLPETWSSAQGSGDTSIAPELAAGGLIPIIDVRSWKQDNVWYQPPWTAEMYITVQTKYSGNWLRCTDDCSGGDYHASLGGTLTGYCPMSNYRPPVTASYANRWWPTLEGLEAAIEAYNNISSYKVAIESILPWTAYHSDSPTTRAYANNSNFVSLAYV